MSLAAALAVAAGCSSASGSSGSSGASGSTGASGSAVPASSGTSSASPYVWGVTTALSGPLAPIGQAILQGVTAYADSVNAGGGINGHPVKVDSLDDQEVASQAITDVTELIDSDHAQVIFDGMLDSNCTAVSSILTRNQVPEICAYAPTSAVKPASPYIFLSGYVYPSILSAVTGYAEKNVTAHPKFAVMADDDPDNTEFVNELKSAGASGGYSVVSAQYVAATAASAATQASVALAAKPDAIIAGATPAQVQSIANELKQQGSDIPILDYVANESFGVAQNIASTQLKNFTSFQFVSASSTSPAVAAYVKAVELANGNNSSAAALNNYAEPVNYIGAYAVGQALKSCGWPCSGQQLATALNKVSFSLPGLVQNFSYTSTVHTPAVNFYVETVKADGTSALTATFPSS